MKKAGYIVINRDKYTDFVKDVRSYMRLGYKPQGGVSVVFTDRFNHYQAMVLRNSL